MTAASSTGRTVATAPAPARLETGGYVNLGSSYAEYLNWRDTDGSLDGTLQLVTVTGSAGNQVVTPQTESVTGTISGSTLVLSLGSAAQVFGTITPTGFTINVPQQTGELAAASFTIGTVDSYNMAVSALRQQVDDANTAARQAAVAAEAATLARGAVDSDVANLDTNYQQLVTHEGWADQANAPGSWTSMALADVRSDLGNIESYWSELQADEALASGYRPTGAPTAAQYGATVNAAEAFLAAHPT